MKDAHWYLCLVLAAEMMDSDLIQEMMMYADRSRDSYGVVWC